MWVGNDDQMHNSTPVSLQLLLIKYEHLRDSHIKRKLSEIQVEVLDVQRCEDSTAVTHVTAGPVSEGASVKVKVDWERRYDHMQQHTGQHLFSAVCEWIMGLETVSWELHARADSQSGNNDVMVDLATPSVSAEQIEVIAFPLQPQLPYILMLHYGHGPSCEGLLILDLLTYCKTH